MPSFSIPVESDIFKLLLHPDVSNYMTLYWNTEGFLKDISLTIVTWMKPHQKCMQTSTPPMKG